MMLECDVTLSPGGGAGFAFGGSEALSTRITHSVNGAHIGVLADGCSASFSNITMKVPG